MTIVDNYVALLSQFHIRSFASFCDRFYQRMTHARFEEILKTYRIVPEQHRDKHVIDALEQIQTAGEKAPQEEREERQSRCPVIIVDGRHEYMWSENLAIAADMIKTIDCHASHVPSSDPERLTFLHRRREKFQRVLDYYGDPSHSQG